MSERTMSENEAMRLLGDLTAGGIRCWVMGGWGVDALVGHQTRAHHDLDLLVAADDLPALRAWLREQGFVRCYEWEENSPLSMSEGMWDTAFVERHADGREVDVHAVHVSDGPVRPATIDPWELPSDTLTGIGQIGGQEVACASARGQRAMHVGYDLPEKHRKDLHLLEGL